MTDSAVEPMASTIGTMHFISAGPLNQRTGGYLYDSHVVEELRHQGWDVVVHALPGTHPLADQVARDAGTATLKDLPDRTIVVIDGLAIPAVAGGLATEAMRLDVVALIHHPLCKETGLPTATAEALHAIETAAIALCDRIIVTSPYTVGELDALGIAIDRVTVIVPGTEAANRARGSDGPGIEIITVGTVTPRKAHSDLVVALSQVAARNWHLTLVGDRTRDQAEIHRLDAAIESTGLTDYITLVGVLDSDQLSQLYDRSDLFVLASHYEGYGMVFAEAMARGLPIIGTTGGAIPGTVPDTAGRLVPPGDIVALAAVLTELIGDADVRRRLAEGSWQAGHRLPTWPETTKRFAAVLSRGSA